MAWTERQRAMLREIGVEPWQPPAAEAKAAAAAMPAAAPATAAVPAAGRHASPDGAGGATAAPADAVPAHVVPADVASPDPAALDWPALRAAVAGCRACALCGARRQTVFGVGHERAHWMVVGEAPGEQEDLQGEPFVGPAGRLLDAMLAALDLTRAPAPPERQVYIANTLKCRPPGNRNPQPDELARCLPYLARQIALVQPRIVLALGRFAVQALLGSDEPIGRLRGRVHRYRGLPLVVSYHPAYLLRQPADKAKAWDDLCLAVEVVEAAGAAAPPAAGPGQARHGSG
jgi:DNA polymerase